MNPSRIDYRSFLFCTITRAMIGCWIGTVASLTAHADTSLVRELAKGTPRVVILVSGPQAAELGKTVQGAILRQPDNKKRKADDIPIISLDDVSRENIAGSKGASVSFILLLARKEWHGSIPDYLAVQLPVQLSTLPNGDGILKSEMTSSGSRGTAFTTVIVAPDDQRLKPLCDQFVARTASRFTGLPFSLDFHTHKIAVFSAPEDKSSVSEWGHVTGSNIWSDARWYPLAERDTLTPQQLDEFHQVYFLNRSYKDSVVPECAAKMIAGQQLKETTSFIKRDDLKNGCSIAVFSVPNSTLLQARAQRYSDFKSISGGQVTDDVKDLRHIGRTTLLISGVGPNPQEKEAIRLLIARAMRQNLNVPVEERGEVLSLLQKEVTLEELQGATGTADLLRRKAKLRYVWLFTIVEYAGGTEYLAGEQKLREDTLVPYDTAHRQDDPEPLEPVAGLFEGRGKKKEAELKHPQWEIDHQAWLNRKTRYEETASARLTAQFGRQITCTTTARVRGVLRLIDLQDQEKPVEVVWDYDCHGSVANGPSIYKQDTVTVPAGSVPSSLNAPPNTDNCSANLLQAATVNAASVGLKQLKENAWLPDGTIAEAPEVPISPKKADGDDSKQPLPPTVSTNEPQVAAIEGNVVTVTIGAASGVRIGDRVQVLVETREIKHPTTGKVLETRILQSVLLKVTRIGATADCVPLNSQEATKIAQIKIGLSIRTWHAAPLPPPANSKNTKNGLR